MKYIYKANRKLHRLHSQNTASRVGKKMECDDDAIIINIPEGKAKTKVFEYKVSRCDLSLIHI